MKIQHLILKLIPTLFFISCQHINSISDLVAPNAERENQKPKYERPKIFSKESLLNVPYRVLDTQKTITSFGFGSCNDQNLPQPLWTNILDKKPDLFIMLGDNVYSSEPKNKPVIDQYIKWNENQDYLKLREAVPFMATWDDHDYGQNDGGFNNPEKAEYRKAFLNYWKYLQPILPKNQDGIYHSRIVGTKNNRVQFIMLDTRSNRSELVLNPNYVSPNESTEILSKKFFQNTDAQAKVLSEEQWKWLESELKKPSEVRILGSSIQVLAKDHGFEKWDNFPIEKERLLKLIEKLKIKNLIIISGDRHLASIAMTNLGKYQLYDVTSSSLNRPGQFTKPETDQSYIGPSFLGINYGMAYINWPAKSITFEILDQFNKAQLSQTISFK